ncbi:MAG TPA: trigger factor, partial [Alphaproteobacteria bacterium]|nr:trigger factor [Alphaproteobacteria bacterium]
MNVTETLSQGLRREFRVVVNAQSLDQMLNSKLAEMQPRLNLKGFRPGKAPLSHLKRTFGKSILGDIINETVSEQSQRAVTDRGLRTAMQPQISLDSEMEQVLSGTQDLIFNVAVDLMPEFQPADLTDVTLIRPVTQAADEDVEDAIKRMADQQRSYEPKAVDAEGANGDQLIVDFEGRIDGEIFEGGTAENARIVLGSGTFLPGFEEQLLEAKPGDVRTVNLTFPDDYSAANLAGKAAVFTVTVKEVLQPVDAAIDDDLAQKLGLESLEQLRAAIRGQMEQDFLRASRTHLKRAMLDALDSRHSFELPAAMVEAEFGQIWAQVEKDLKDGNLPEEDKSKSEDDL